jgi:hypothetical protein
MSSVSKLRKMTIDNRDTDTYTDTYTDTDKNKNKVSTIRQLTIDNRDIDKETPQTKMQKLRKDSSIHEVIPGRGMSSYEEGIAIKNLRAHYEEKNKAKTNPAGGFKTRSRKTRKNKKSKSRKSKSRKSKSRKSKSRKSRSRKSRSKSKRRF